MPALSLMPRLHHNFHVILTCLLWYSVSSVSSQVTKTILNEFPFPLALGEVQFVLVSLFSLVALLTVARVPAIHALFPPGSVPALDQPAITRPSRHILITVLPLGCFQFLGKLFSHSATALVPVSTVAGVKTLSPLVLVLVYRLLYKVKFPLSTYLSLLPLVFGILLIVIADTKDTLVSTTASTQYVGILYAGLSLIVFVGQNIYGKTVFTYNQKNLNDHTSLALSSGDSSLELATVASVFPTTQDEYKNLKEKELSLRSQNYELEMEKSKLTSFPQVRNRYDKLTILLYCSLLGGLLSLPWFLYIESPHLFPLYPAVEDHINLSSSTSSPTAVAQQVAVIPWTLLLINGFSHFFQSLIVFHLLGAIPAVSYSIASMMKKITVIVVSIVYAGHDVTPIQLVGLVLTGVGLYSYDRWGGRAG